MKIAIDIGHNCPPDTGALGVKSEDEMNRLVGEFLIKLLISAGVDVIDCRPKSATTVGLSLWKRTNSANTCGADFYVSLHHNAGGGLGSEVFAVSDEGIAAAKRVLSKLVGLGFRDRGVKRQGFYVIKNTLMPAILVEVCFVDSNADCTLWDKLGCKAIAQAIFEGLQESLKF
ncbi:MAG: N-acetylmuramoyl-L-alanine amidase [Methylacidiphilales bacterium]|nr:N-acetylmuramoyl-L-alanine amidase [Candidatus Methylacidiphilales bacterium]NJR19329.1 N-acetylmuramoyl-L-alanine amidase [Calothrix sp. CSU_2_0]